jgi:16S rRNA (guanine527-N7)-methyltransferase
VDRKLHQKALDYGIELSEQHHNLFRIYLDEIVAWNKRLNITGLHERERIINELIFDSLIPSPFLPEEGWMLDVGSGAGFPGIPIKIYRPQLKTILLEANAKKVNFLKWVIRLLKLDEIRVVQGRIERNGGDLRPHGYHIITARALTNIRQVMQWCSSFLLPDGLLVTFLGRQAEGELKKSEYLMERHSLTPYRIIPYFLPETGSKRSIVIFKKMECED